MEVDACCWRLEEASSDRGGMRGSRSSRTVSALWTGQERRYMRSLAEEGTLLANSSNVIVGTPGGGYQTLSSARVWSGRRVGSGYPQEDIQPGECAESELDGLGRCEGGSRADVGQAVKAAVVNDQSISNGDVGQSLAPRCARQSASASARRAPRTTAHRPPPLSHSMAALVRESMRSTFVDDELPSLPNSRREAALHNDKHKCGYRFTKGTSTPLHRRSRPTASSKILPSAAA